MVVSCWLGVIQIHNRRGAETQRKILSCMISHGDTERAENILLLNSEGVTY